MKDGYSPKRPWVLSPGIFGKGGEPGTFTERVAAKKNTSARDMGLSTYDWIAAGGKGQAIALSASPSASLAAPADLSVARVTAAATARMQAASYRLARSVRSNFSHNSAVFRQPVASLVFS